jgi:hypothetical protein
VNPGEIAGAKYTRPLFTLSNVLFSKLDLRKGYDQITMVAKYIPKTAVITTFGLLEFLRMPTELKNAVSVAYRPGPSRFRFCLIYLDDVMLIICRYLVQEPS